MKISSSSLLSSLLSLGLYADFAGLASAYVISDERVRSLDVTPVLGKGYGIQSNSYHSICLKFPTTTEPTYDYKYYLTDLTNSSDYARESAMSGEFGGSFGAPWIGLQIGFGAGAGRSNTTSTNTFERHVIATMRIDRYYSSIDERNAEFSDDAKTLLERADYVGFFKACGPNYIRSIRRAQEVSAKFTFKAEDEAEAIEFMLYLRGHINGLRGSGGGSSSERVRSTESTLEIEIKGWGLGLDKEGSETLVAKSLDEFNDVMKFAYNTMTRGNEGIAETGMVYGIEVVPWVDNALFQAAVDMPAHQLNKAVDEALIPEATNGMCSKGISDDINKCCLQSDMEDVPMPEVSDVLSEDGTGICDKCQVCSTSECNQSEQCQAGAICKRVLDVPEAKASGCHEFEHMTEESFFEKKHCIPKNPNRTLKICRPVRPVPLEIMKQNALTNAEFVTVMDSVLRSKMNTAFALERCISSLKGIPSRHDNTFLKSADKVWDSALEMNITVADLRHALDPDGRLSTLTVVKLEIEEYMQKFYSPCLAALHGANDSGRDGNEIDGDPIATDRKLQSHFMTTPYFEHEQCSHSSCLLHNHRWDRHHAGCKPGLLTGGAEPGSTNDLTDSAMNAHCSKKLNPNTMTYECKISSDRYSELLTDITNCWGNPNYVPFRLIETFCDPHLSTTSLDVTSDQEPTRICTQPEVANDTD